MEVYPSLSFALEPEGSSREDTLVVYIGGGGYSVTVVWKYILNEPHAS